MKLKNIFALLLIIVLGFALFQALAARSGSDGLTVNRFGEASIKNRTAAHYLAKDVNKAENTTQNKANYSKEIIYGKTSNAESGSANIVTSVVVNYRSFDTLGEVTILFLAATALSAILANFKSGKKRKVIELDGSLILTRGVKLLFPLLLLLGAYIFIHGHLTPGGGFQGGAIIATGFLLLFIARKDYSLKHRKLELLEALSGAAFVIIGLIGLISSGSFLTNFLSTGTVGNLFSAGIIPIIYILIGIKVGAELSGIINNLLEA